MKVTLHYRLTLFKHLECTKTDRHLGGKDHPFKLTSKIMAIISPFTLQR